MNYVIQSFQLFTHVQNIIFKLSRASLPIITKLSVLVKKNCFVVTSLFFKRDSNIMLNGMRFKYFLTHLIIN